VTKPDAKAARKEDTAPGKDSEENETLDYLQQNEDERTGRRIQPLLKVTSEAAERSPSRTANVLRRLDERKADGVESRRNCEPFQPRPRRKDAQAAVDVGETTFGIARWQDRGLGDSTVARAGFQSSHQSSTAYIMMITPLRGGVACGTCANRISGPGRARARPWLEVRLADASPTDGVQDAAATTGGRAGVQQVKLWI
jgi:hypothetical protein